MTGRLGLASMAAAVAVTGCAAGGSKIDPHKAESFVRGQLLGPRPSSIDCPKDVDAKQGRTFGCTIVYPDGTSATVTVHVVSDSGRIRVSPADFHAHPPG
jgi:Domain of unknown function (DUF4333)